MKLKIYYMVVSCCDRYTFTTLKGALDFAEQLSMSEEAIDTDIKVVEIKETKIETFRNGGVVA